MNGIAGTALTYWMLYTAIIFGFVSWITPNVIVEVDKPLVNTSESAKEMVCTYGTPQVCREGSDRGFKKLVDIDGE